VHEGKDPRDGAEAKGEGEIMEEGPAQHAVCCISKATPLSLVGMFSKFFKRTTTATSSQGPLRPLVSNL